MTQKTTGRLVSAFMAICLLAFITLATLRILGIIALSWWLISATLWAPVLIFFFVLGFMAFIAFFLFAPSSDKRSSL